jgi:hypothetical protein
MYKPMNVTVDASATLLLPAATPKASDVQDFDLEEAMTLAVGDIVKTSAGRLYWCVAAGDTDYENEPYHDDGDATNGTATLRAHHARREYLALVNHGAEAVSLGLGETAVDGKGIRLNGLGGSIEFKAVDGRVPQGKVTAICASGGSTTVGVQDG